MATVGKFLVLLLVVIGIILVLVAKIHAASLITKDYDPWEDNPDDVKQIEYNSTVLSAIGTALIPLGLFFAAITMEDLGPHTRSGLAIAGGVIIALTSFAAFI